MKKKSITTLVVRRPRVDHVIDKQQVKKAVVPPPTKAEIVEALVVKKHQEWMEECKKFAEKDREILDAFEKGVREAVKANPSLMFAKMDVKTLYHGEISVVASIQYAALPAATQAAIRAYKNWGEERRQKQPRQFDHNAVRAQMRQALTCDPARVNALVKSPEITATLAHIEKNTPKLPVTLECNGHHN